MRWLYRLQNRIGLAAPEGTAALVILVALAAGTVARHVQASASPVSPDLYAASDAAFEAADGPSRAAGVVIEPVSVALETSPDPLVVVSPDSAATPVPEAEPAPARRSTKATPVRTGINTATASDLERLPGIGPALAGRIVAHRQQIGRFRQADQLIEVKGIGPKTFEKMKPWVVVD